MSGDFNLEIESPFIVWEEGAWNDLVRDMKPKYWRKGRFLYREGEQCDDVFLVDSARVKLSVTNGRGDQKINTFADHGCLIGEMSALSGKSNITDAEVVHDGYIYTIPAKQFLEMVFRDKDLYLQLLSQLVEKNRILNFQLRMYAYSDAAAMMAYLLLAMAKDYGEETPNGILLSMPLTQYDLANLTGLSRVTVSKTLNRFADEGVIFRSQTGFYITDEERLRNHIRF